MRVGPGRPCINRRSTPQESRRKCRRLLTWFCLLVWAQAAVGQSLYKYRDDSGRWVFTDRQPAETREYERGESVRNAVAIAGVTVQRQDAGTRTRLLAVNSCLCPMQVAVAIMRAKNVAVVSSENFNKETFNVVVPASSRLPVVMLEAADADMPWSFDFEFGYLHGDPAASHHPAQPYRPPFAAGKAHRVSQAYPDKITHDTPDSEYAIDIAMPEQSGVYAAREGLVVAVAYSNFRGGLDRKRFGAQANLVRILHDDGTFGIYAHLGWDSIRVRPGQRVARGQYIADSGNTGFSTGPHLHFVVVRNKGLKAVSVPVNFLTLSNSAAPARSGEFLRNR